MQPDLTKGNSLAFVITCNEANVQATLGILSSSPRANLWLWFFDGPEIGKHLKKEVMRIHCSSSVPQIDFRCSLPDARELTVTISKS